MRGMATSKKPVSPKKKTATKTVKKSVPKAKASAKKAATKTSVSQKVDYYPNRMTVAVAALAGTLLVLISLIAVLGVQ